MYEEEEYSQRMMEQQIEEEHLKEEAYNPWLDFFDYFFEWVDVEAPYEEFEEQVFEFLELRGMENDTDLFHYLLEAHIK